MAALMGEAPGSGGRMGGEHKERESERRRAAEEEEAPWNAEGPEGVGMQGARSSGCWLGRGT